MAEIILFSQFGIDHWSLLLFIETVCVDHRGVLRDDSRRRMSTGQMRTFVYGDQNSPTRLKDGELADEKHDDWACLDDFAYAGILDVSPAAPDFPGPDGIYRYSPLHLSDYGWYLAHMLRRMRAEGISISTFNPISQDEFMTMKSRFEALHT